MFAKLKKVVFILLLLQLIACSRTEFTDAQGNEFGWDDFRGRWLVINYWAEWCKPCLEEIPELNQLYQHHRNDSATVLGINFDRLDLAELRRQITALNVQFPVLQSDPEQKLDYLLPEVLPTTYIFDREGKLAHKLVGPQTQASIEAYLEDN
ncbi:MAG: TlpA family protein disulfide reductase [Pseudomonadales bacterium]|nr:TlpA family protein disulfide reductase [Pseudomonadales bacterium]MCP5213956.1 TlpA family protein disulfide reductase [Pseudomonadales bacterium]MCP5302834.1 TlpA family protein disulfide reductase [Pseudomonadales bacterium]